MLNTFPAGEPRITGTSGFSLVEMLIVIAIIAIATTLGLPSYRAWVHNTQIRNAGESIQNGMQKARSEAVARNTNVEFALLGVGPTWVASWEVRVVNPAEVLESVSGTEGSKNVTARGYSSNDPVVTTEATTITFSSLSTVVANADASATLRRVALDSTALEAADSRDLWVTIGSGDVGSSVRLCDPNLASGSSPRAC